MPSDARKQADEALARYGRIEAVLEAQRQLTPAERALLPHAMFDETDLVVLQGALRCERELGAGPSQFAAALGLAPTWRSQSRRGRTREILASLPDMPVAAIRKRLARL